MSFAYHTAIAISKDQTTAIERIPEGEKVLDFDVFKAGKAGVSQESAVNFSAGSPPPNSAQLIHLTYNLENRTLLVTPRQPFLMADGSLKRAENLVLGDQLLTADGTAVAILSIAIGEYTGGIHDISVGTNVVGDPNGHLLLANGVIAGDFSLEINEEKMGAPTEVSSQ